MLVLDVRHHSPVRRESVSAAQTIEVVHACVLGHVFSLPVPVVSAEAA